MNILQKNNYGNTLLHLIALNKNKGIEEYKKIVEYLLKNKKIDINTKNNDWQTPLLKVLEKWNFNVATVLVENWADLNFENNFENNYADIVKNYQQKTFYSEKEMILKNFLYIIKEKKIPNFLE